MNRLLKPAVIAGASFGVLAGLPFIGCLNLACCALAIAGGFFAAFLYLQQAPAAATPPAPPYGDAAVLGLLTGAIGAVVGAVVSIPFSLLGVAAGGFEGFSEILADLDLPPELQDPLAGIGALGVGTVAIVVGFLINVALYSVFAMLGALLGVAVLSRSA